ncbi:MAG: leucyl aminopeptidase family protein [Roseomonas sp.]|nr:leucyl aminopeptidase family protein [Roseomonas sp.]MCA3380651.1 leucyl aminopeptidase family protein [Roseomonas sp.]
MAASGQAQTASSAPLHAVSAPDLPAFMATLATPAAAFIRASGFTAKPGEIALIPAADGLAGAVLGIGPNFSLWDYGAAPWALPEGSLWHLAGNIADPADAVLGWHLGAYCWLRHKHAQRAPAELVLPQHCDLAVAMAEAICAARDLINTPAMELGPRELAKAAAELAERHGGRAEIITGGALSEGFPCMAAVGAGSPRAPHLAVLHWEGDANGPLIALCGKGVCFDTGGLDLKPSAAMLRMKKDMGGAAIMLAVAEMVMRAKLPLRLLVLIGAVENAVSGQAMRPMDVLRTRKGLRVEIGNTDAEGRLVLSDLLQFAAEQKPALILDAATLTGAARVALGPDLPALFSNDDALAERLLRAGAAVQDPLWRLPLHDGYDSWLDSPFADLSNVSQKPMAGAVTAALFLRRFVPQDQPWAHFDVYAWNDSTRPGRPEGGEAQAARAIFAMLCDFTKGM